MFSSIISAATRHVPILVLTLVFFRLIPSLYSWLAKPSPLGPWKLSYEDVLEARAILGSLKLPTELALQILDHAEYWPSLTFSSPQNPHGSSIKAAATHTAPSAATLCLAADILTPELYPALETVVSHGETPRVKAIEFSIVSRDQGWTSEPTHGTFSTSSWLEVSLLRGWHPDARYRIGFNHRQVALDTSLPPSCWLPSVFGSPKAFQTHIVSHGWGLVERPEEAEQGPQGGEGGLAWYLQGNRVATQGRCEQYSVRWTRSGDAEGNEGCGTGQGFLENLREGDQVLVWARAKWPGWQCVVERVEATVYYGFS